MDIEQKIDKIAEKVDALNIMMTRHISKDEGLQLPERMDRVELKVKQKVSWVGLSGALSALSVVVGLIFVIIKEA